MKSIANPARRSAAGDRGVSYAQASEELKVHPTQLPSSVKALAGNPEAFSHLCYAADGHVGLADALDDFQFLLRRLLESADILRAITQIQCRSLCRVAISRGRSALANPSIPSR